MSRNARFGLLGLAAVIVVAAIVAIGTGGGSSSKYSGRATVTVVHGKAEGGIVPLTYKKGQTIDLTVKSDTPDEIHIHGYDRHQTVPRGGSVHFRFPATIEGRFVIELEAAKQQIASLTVQP